MKRRMLCLAVVVCLMCALAPSALAWATLDNYISANFGRSYDVYSGPGTNYYRANLGRAMYGGGAFVAGAVFNAGIVSFKPGRTIFGSGKTVLFASQMILHFDPFP